MVKKANDIDVTQIMNPRNYLYMTMRNTFDKWQNDILRAEKEEDSDNNKK